MEQLLSREGRGCRDKRATAMKKRAALGQGPGSASRDTHNNIFKLFIELRPPTNGRCQHSSFQRRPAEARLKEPKKFIKRLLETRLKECRPYTHPNPISNPGLVPLL